MVYLRPAKPEEEALSNKHWLCGGVIIHELGPYTIKILNASKMEQRELCRNAFLKVESDFNFQRRVKGCDFIPQKIAFNNQSADLERAGQVGTTAGWEELQKTLGQALPQDHRREYDLHQGSLGHRRYEFHLCYK
ncbi:Uncharacterized protein OBRU01_22482 [Operophtera brumata]|uniref:Uncharacterized protein n=1 Tax=Operophtera brumata TaxID=104452 RepID=A0A0L7KRC2_OPEBR|nr:Uncharacterized protein OBRU01_22482 [Operophtera brumata]